MKAMVFAAGLGTRLRPITDSLPKALVPVCGEPLLYHTLHKLKSAGYTDIVVNIHHFPQMIREYLQTHDFGLDVSISDESDRLLETGGGILHARNLLLPLDEPFLVHNVDIVSNLDIAWFRAQMRPDALATLLVSERKTQRYLLFNEEMRLVGWTNIGTGEVRSPYKDLDPARCHGGISPVEAGTEERGAAHELRFGLWKGDLLPQGRPVGCPRQYRPGPH